MKVVPLYAWFVDAGGTPGLIVVNIQGSGATPLITPDFVEATEGAYGDVARRYAKTTARSVFLVRLDSAVLTELTYTPPNALPPAPVEYEPTVEHGYTVSERTYTCPTCSTVDRFITHNPLRPAAPALCLGCGSWSWIDDIDAELVLRLPTNDELARIRKDPECQKAQAIADQQGDQRG